MTDLDSLVLKAKSLDAQIVNLENEVCSLSKSDEEEIMKKLQETQRKLKFQLSHLKRAIVEEETISKTHSPVVISMLCELFACASLKAFPDLPLSSYKMLISQSQKFGDYQCSSSMMISSILKKQFGQSLSPKDVGEKLVGCLPERAASIVSDCQVAPAGFINFNLHPDYVTPHIVTMATKGVCPPYVPLKRRVVIDFSSPNIAKEMHVGHLRSTIIGDALARLHEFLGHTVVRLNHIGDWGTQFGMLIAHLQSKFPTFMQNPPAIADLQAFYKESKKRFDDDEDFKKKAYASVVALQSGDTAHLKAWKLICQLSAAAYNDVYDRLNVHGLVERGESFYQKHMETLMAELKTTTVVNEETGKAEPVLTSEEGDGRLLMWGRKQDKCATPLIMVKSDGGFTYDTSDMAALRHRLIDEDADLILYVVDNGQALHFQTIYSVGKRLGWYYDIHEDVPISGINLHATSGEPEGAKLGFRRRRVEHVGFGVVLGEDKKKFKTRSGDTVRLVDLLDEGMNRAAAKLAEKGRDKEMTPDELLAAQKAVAYGCIRFADLSQCRTSDYVFSFDKMLDDRGKTAVYLLYALTRVRSIARTAGHTRATVLAKGTIRLDHPKELRLAKVLLRFGDVITRCATELMPHYLCDFIYEVAVAFSEFYDVCYCLSADKNDPTKKVANFDRLLLCEAVGNVMETSLNLLGVKTVDRM